MRCSNLGRIHDSTIQQTAQPTAAMSCAPPSQANRPCLKCNGLSGYRDTSKRAGRTHPSYQVGGAERSLLHAFLQHGVTEHGSVKLTSLVRDTSKYSRFSYHAALRYAMI